MSESPPPKKDAEGVEISALFGVGDEIEFDFFGETKRGRVTQIGDHGYWIRNNQTRHGWLRCPFDKAHSPNDQAKP